MTKSAYNIIIITFLFIIFEGAYIRIYAQENNTNTLLSRKEQGEHSHLQNNRFFRIAYIQSIKQQHIILRVNYAHKLSSLEQTKPKLESLCPSKEKNLIIRNKQGKNLGYFHCSRIDSHKDANAKRHTFLYGQVKLESDSLDSMPKTIALRIGYEMGIYKSKPKHIPIVKKQHSKTHHKVITTIRQHKDDKEMIYIASDIVIYGQDSDASLASFNPYFRDRMPENAIRLNAFYMDKYEVTNAEYLYFCRKSNYPLPLEWKSNSKKPYPLGKASHPFHKASYHDAQAYARWAKKRLPSELEWEMAARGGASLLIQSDTLGALAQPPIYSINARNARNARGTGGNAFNPQLCNTYESGYNSTQSVYDLKDKSPYGIIGMCGNAREWTSSWFMPYPKHYWNKQGLSGKIYKVIRGGSFFETQQFARTDYRNYGGLPSLSKDFSAGFRLVMNAK